MAALVGFTSFDKEGKPVDGGTIQLPDYLDWMPIDVKVEYIKYIGQGHDQTQYALIVSQGERRLITDAAFSRLDGKQYKERFQNAEAHIDRFVKQHGISRVPRNQ